MLVKMFAFFLVLLQLLSALNAESLVDLPLKLDDYESLMIEAILTAQANGEKYFLQEFISVHPYDQGKIEISSKSDSIQVHYAVSRNEHFETNKRLVVQETSCDLFSYSTKWDKMLPNINKPLLNLILLLGPSVFYRINGYSTAWKKVASSNVRGKNMIGYQTSINQRLKITYYYKSEFDKNDRKPSRIVFDGYDPGSSFSPNENLIMDIYSIDRYPNVFAEHVQVTPGVGCPLYVSDSKVMPSLRSTQIQMIVEESVVGSSTSLTKDEYYIDNGRSLIRRITTHLGITVDAIYDYNLGLIYVLQDQSCLVQPMGLSSPALDQDGIFSWQSLLWMDVVYFYLGEVNFESYPGFKVSAWEAVTYDKTLHSGKYDKVVTTIYMAKSDERDLFYGYTLVGSVRKAYKKGSNGNYILVETTKRNYYDARSTASEDEFDDRFQVGDCYKSPESRIELVFKLSCSAQGCLKLAEDMLTEFKYAFKSYILSDYTISPLRIDDISFEVNDDRLVAFTTFLEKPTFNSAFQKRGVYIPSDYLNKLSGVNTADESQCLEYQAAYFAPISYVLYCTKSKRELCYHVEKGSKLVTGGSENFCKVYDVPLGNFHRFGQELNLKDIHESMLDKARYSTLYFRGVKYQVEDVVDKTQLFNDEAQFPFQVAIHQARIKEDHNFQVVYAEKVANLGQCYRECLHSDETICETFSYCESSTGVECLITKSPFETISDNITIDKSCNTYSKNYYSDYFKVPKKKFISTASATINIPLYDCASLCHSSKGCYSFQFCDGYCTFGGYFTDSNTEYDEKCDVYVPKVSNNYQITGKKIVEQAYHTELNLNMAQCAAICYDISDGDQKCKSFNYCPKGRTPSSCLLTIYSVNDPNTKTIESENCYNYEILDKGNSKKVSVNEKPKGTSSGAAFGIIMFFLVGGLAIGFVIPIAYNKVKLAPSVSSIRERFQQGSTDVGFGWSKQVNEDEGRSRLDQTTSN